MAANSANPRPPRPDILRQILATKAAEIERAARARPLPQLRAECETAPPTRGFVAALENRLAQGKPAVIAEIKKASPSRGVIRAEFAPSALATEFAEHGAACLSVLTDETYFQGHGDYLGTARAACGLPVLRKDFVIDPYQVYESRLLGADAILLIVAALGTPLLSELAHLAQDLGLDVLVEIHQLDELERALALPCRLLGINNRNLRTFDTDLNTTLDLLPKIPTGRIVVTESGIATPTDVAMLRAHGVHAFLTGEALMRSRSPGAALRALFDETKNE